MADVLAKIGAVVGAASFTLLFFFDEPECPKSLIK